MDGEQDAPPPIGRINLPEFVRREIRDVRSIDTGFSFTTVERELTFGSDRTVFTTYEVRNDPDEDGIYLVRVVREDSSGEVRSRFEPRPAVLMLPLPVSIGVEFESVGVDPASLEVLRHSAKIESRKRIDACGDPVDSFFAEAFQEFVRSDGAQTQRKYDYGVATQFGGMFVFEHVATPCVPEEESPGERTGSCSNEPQLVFDARLGQLEPDPPGQR